MAFYYAFTCDVCGQIDAARPTAGYWSHRLPKGWRSIDGRDACSLECVASYARRPDEYPKQKLDPDPMVQRLTESIIGAKKTGKAASA
jgi:hypothetical protein